MIPEVFLVCALAVPSTYHSRPWFASQDEKSKIVDWIRKWNPGSDVFIHPQPQEDKLKEDGWERFPATWKGEKIWIKRKPKSDRFLRCA